MTKSSINTTLTFVVIPDAGVSIMKQRRNVLTAHIFLKINIKNECKESMLSMLAVHKTN
jgi:hypothetical protein